MNTSAKQIAERMKRAAKVKTYGQLGDILDGISSQAISSAIAKDKIPGHWFDIIEERFGVGREELCRPLTHVSASLVQRWGDNIQGNATTGAGSPMITGHHIGEVTVTVGDQVQQVELSPRELQLILRMRKYAPPALWEKIEQELNEQEERYR